MVKETAYCLVCKKKVKAEGKVSNVKTPHGTRKQFRGKCPNCGTTVCKYMKSDN